MLCNLNAKNESLYFIEYLAINDDNANCNRPMMIHWRPNSGDMPTSFEVYYKLSWDEC